MQKDYSLVGNLPNSMKQIVFSELLNLVQTLRQEYNANYKVQLLTSMGTIIGDIEPCAHKKHMIGYSDDPNNFTLDISSIFGVLTEKYKIETGTEGITSPEYSDAYMINIKDAVLYERGMSKEIAHFEQLILFADQIIGFALVRE